LFSHVFVATNDFERALAFYRPLLALLGVAERFCDPSRPWAGWQSTPGPRPLLLLGAPFEGRHHARAGRCRPRPGARPRRPL
jgi:lactoylglutathione lyase